MDMSSNFRPEFHIAQQSRRERLRIQTVYHHHHLNNMDGQDQIQQPEGLPYEYCSGQMLNFPAPANSSQGNNFKFPIPNTVASSGDPQCFSTWKSIGSQSTSDWVVHQSNYPPIFVGNGLSSSSSFKLINNSNNGNNNNDNPVVESNPGNDISIPSYHYNPNPLQELVIASSSNVHPYGRVQFGGQELNNYSSGRNNDDNGDGEVTWTGTNDISETQALSLSLSSVPLQAAADSSSPSFHDYRNLKPENLPKIWGNYGRHDLGTLARRNPRPLGPFTGYETILRSSKFLKPAQQLLEELCCFDRPNNGGNGAGKALEEIRVSNGDSVAIDAAGKNRALNCGTDSIQPPENLQKKAKLLYLQDEVCKRYKQYHQQMQMVVSSFETVAGLSTATPYISSALKMVSKHFHCLRNAIIDQLKSIRNALGEDPPAPSAGTSNSKDDPSNLMLKFFDQSSQKQKRSAAVGGFLDGQHIWRPQRGLPDQAVSILRAWLFDHFLHPYPTDTDKHMLASQTGLTRNQVSNWFINARVRLWKPMVEEIHMLESKGMVEAGKPIDQPNTDNNDDTQNFAAMSSMPSSTSLWNQEKCARIEYHAPSSIGGSLMGWMPGVEIGGLSVGAVSLTLGLRQGAENAQRGPQPEHNVRLRFGSQMIRDFVG
ncbi:BEL1-like homeodomain protein 8 [Andrographis paniculata]|uniref:BEL1-like homeodomain protein 8 n=1 Tax=Andrographis paniculata TaxID=175694 RepID=UPI0021E84BFF|nr:BEL1-like homeodomain protein 8 [Andrographis paniculata]